jgi:NAD(P)H-dependent FMN reductase
MESVKILGIAGSLRQASFKDETARRLIRQLLQDLADWTRRLAKGRA